MPSCVNSPKGASSDRPSDVHVVEDLIVDPRPIANLGASAAAALAEDLCEKLQDDVRRLFRRVDHLRQVQRTASGAPGASGAAAGAAAGACGGGGVGLGPAAESSDGAGGGGVSKRAAAAADISNEPAETCRQNVSKDTRAEEEDVSIGPTPPQVEAPRRTSAVSLMLGPTYRLPGFESVARLPRALAARFGHVEAESGSEPEEPLEDKKLQGMRWHQHSLPQGPAGIALDGRWRDLFLSNEQQMEEEDSVTEKFKAMSKPNRKSKQSDDHIQHRLLKEDDKSGEVPLRPHGWPRLLWDCSGMTLMFYDVIMIPLYIGWDQSVLFNRTLESGAALLAIAFWTMDIVLSFNTGFFDARGSSLEMSRRRVASHYVFGWLPFDMFLVLLDIVFVAFDLSFLRAVRGVRALRVLRILRLLKISKVSDILEDILTRFGIQRLIFILSIFRTMFVIFLVTHVCACVWYGIGRIAEEQHIQCWLNLSDDFIGVSVFSQYSFSMYWVLGHLFGAPTDKVMMPMNQVELWFTLLMVFMSLLIIGAAISNMTNTIAELNKMNAEATEVKRQLHRYLVTAGVGRELSTRTIRFAVHSQRRKSAMSLSPSVLHLLSDRLLSELIVTQRGGYILEHPLFRLLKNSHVEVFRTACATFNPHVYADNDIVFNAGTLCECMYVTQTGVFKISTRKRGHAQGGAGWGGTTSGSTGSTNHRSAPRLEDSGLGGMELLDDFSEDLFDERRWICEVSLFIRHIHRSTLMCLSFADALSLSCADLIQCVRLSPRCIGIVYRYAQEYVRPLRDEPDGPTDTMIQDLMPMRLACGAAETVGNVRQNLEYPFESPAADFDLVEQWVEDMFSKDLKDEELYESLPQIFGELDLQNGLYAKMELFDERRRALAGMHSVIWLVKDRYDYFIKGQDPNRCMSPELWAEWQHFVRWSNLSRELVHATLVFLVIRGIGKVRSFAKALPSQKRSPEDVVMHLISHLPNLVPSIRHLNNDMLQLIIKTLMTHSSFNLAQLLQGENTPYQVMVLQDFVRTEGPQLLHFYLFGLVGVMCGIMGGVTTLGSRWMDDENGGSVLLGIQCLQNLVQVSPHAVYWNYISARAKQLGLAIDSEEKLAIARLACLSRTASADTVGLQRAWCSLCRGDKRVLINHFLADGIAETAFLFNFLPLYFANSKKNPCVGLHRALALLIDLLEALRLDGCAERAENMMVMVNLQEVAIFAEKVRNPRVWLACGACSRFVDCGNEVQILVSPEHKQRADHTTCQDLEAMETTGVLRQMQRKIHDIEATLGSLSRDLPT